MKTTWIPAWLAMVLLASGARASFASREGMPSMPLAKEVRVTSVSGKEDFGLLRGFGSDEPTVKMRTLMMVGGSGYEGMEMSAMNMPNPMAMPEMGKIGAKNTSPFSLQFDVTPNPPRTGKNRVDFTLTEVSTRKTASGLALHAEAFMAKMDMGTEEVPVSEISPGHYRMEVDLPMAGSWVVRIQSVPRGEQDRSRRWENILNLEVR